VAAILAFVFSWNYFLFALVLSNGDSKTLIAAAFNFVGEGSTQWGVADGGGDPDRAAAAGFGRAGAALRSRG